MSHVQLRFYAELNDFLRDAQKKTRFTIELNRRTSVKDLIESQGVPHTEVEIILANGVSVDFNYIVNADDDLSIYPMFESVDVTPVLKLRDAPLRETRFVLDCHLGRLARYLRQFGFDTLYRNDYDDDELAQISASEHRILLTRDRSLLKRSIITHGYFVREYDPRKQLDEVIRRFDLKDQLVPFGRCTRCNGRVEQVSKQAIEHLLEPKTRQFYQDFWQCSSCNQVYWEGSHVKHMIRLADELLNPESG
ncbi:MAG: Mut7-C ubiquitin/RNAse domain-containing protein [Gammaproteobacteria bacterium]|nr:Mut7-C ubiquitin/RNAse domain-containing protein [Gammaproteobacteria bacterium]NNL07425.1 Mut7-C ubiquitin/RNAse domain-containing protein [Gammaproteobacteria bacterium]